VRLEHLEQARDHSAGGETHQQHGGDQHHRDRGGNSPPRRRPGHPPFMPPYWTLGLLTLEPRPQPDQCLPRLGLERGKREERFNGSGLCGDPLEPCPALRAAVIVRLINGRQRQRFVVHATQRPFTQMSHA